MSIGSSNSLDGWDCVQDALAEIGARSRALQGVVENLFDQMSRCTDELLLGELSRLRTEHQAERAAFDGQIDRLAALAAELTDVVAKQKK